MLSWLQKKRKAPHPPEGGAPYSDVGITMEP